MMTDNELVLKVKEENCTESFTTLSTKHKNLYYKICQKYGAVLSAAGVYFQDLIDDKDFVVYKAILSYNPEKGTKFSTWLGNHARYHCLNFMNSNCKYVTFAQGDMESILDVIHLNKEDQNDDSQKDVVEQIFSILSRLKDKRIERVYRERYSEIDSKQTWAKIAKKMNISTQTVINLHTRGRKILRNKMKSQKHLDFV